VHIATQEGVEVFDPGTGDRTRLCAAPAAGLCVDADGFAWVAVPTADEIRRITPTGDLDHVLSVPAPTGCCFGGPDFTDLYLTAGSIFVAPAIGTGAPTPRFPG
jgi:sugar lactone lactonase YvrE